MVTPTQIILKYRKTSLLLKKNGIIAPWIARHFSLSKVCPPITELSWQKYNWVYERIRPEQQPLYTMLNKRHIRDELALTLRNKFEVLQEKTETHTPNDEYENFANAHLEAAAEFIPIKQRAKPRVPWETLVVRKKRADVKAASKCNRKYPTNTNALKRKKAHNELANIYLNEQTQYIQNQIDKIRGSVEDRHPIIAWQTVNEVNRTLRKLN